jgi:hypothetical protein
MILAENRYTLSRVEAHAATALREDVECNVAIDADPLLVMRPIGHAIHQETRQDVVDRIGEPLKTDLTGHGRATAVGADDDFRRERVIPALPFESYPRRASPRISMRPTPRTSVAPAETAAALRMSQIRGWPRLSAPCTPRTIRPI